MNLTIRRRSDGVGEREALQARYADIRSSRRHLHAIPTSCGVCSKQPCMCSSSLDFVYRGKEQRHRIAIGLVPSCDPRPKATPTFRRIRVRGKHYTIATAYDNESQSRIHSRLKTYTVKGGTLDVGAKPCMMKAREGTSTSWSTAVQASLSNPRGVQAICGQGRAWLG